MELKGIYWSRKALHFAYSAVVLWLAASIVMALMLKPLEGPQSSEAGISSVSEVFQGLINTVLAAVTLPAVFLAVLFLIATIATRRDVRRRDPIRRFTRQQRREGMERAGGQCEMETDFRRRCTRPAEHGDHFYPWSKGGSSSLQNFVAACARHNRAKGARIPSPGQQERLERRRRDYLAPEFSIGVGERQPLP